MRHPLDSPLGFRADGRAFWAFFGAEGEGEGGDSGGDDGGGDDGGTPPADPDPVKRATAPLLQDLKRTRDQLREMRPLKALMQELGISSPEALREALEASKKGSGTQAPTVDIDAITKKAEKAAEQKALRRVAESKIEARATGKFADPEDAVAALSGDLDDFITAEGKIDTKAIDGELERLLVRKPHFSVKAATGTNFDGGARQTASAPQTMNDWLHKLSADKRGR